MANQYNVNPEKVTDILWLHYFRRWTIKDLSKTLRLNPKTIRRILKKQREEEIKNLEDYRNDHKK